MTDLVTFADFARLAQARGWSAESLASRFRGKIEEPGEFFHRVLQGKPGWDVAIPYRSVIELYQREMSSPEIQDPRSRLCACGCRRPAFGRKKFATKSCRQKGWRKNNVRDIEKGLLVEA